MFRTGLIVFTLVLSLLLGSCGQGPGAARKELEKMNIHYNENNFFKCVEKGDLAAVKLFLTAKMNVNVKNAEGETPLYVACVRGHREVAEFLILKGADVNAANSSGYRPLFRDCEKGWLKVAELLISKGADVNAANISGLKPLNVASSEEMKALLRKHGAKEI